MIKIKTDPTLLTEVRKFGQFDINACYQCGGCTVVCNLTNESASFPRRIVRYALMGFRKPLQAAWSHGYVIIAAIARPHVPGKPSQAKP